MAQFCWTLIPNRTPPETHNPHTETPEEYSTAPSIAPLSPGAATILHARPCASPPPAPEDSVPVNSRNKRDRTSRCTIHARCRTCYTTRNRSQHTAPQLLAHSPSASHNPAKFAALHSPTETLPAPDSPSQPAPTPPRSAADTCAQYAAPAIRNIAPPQTTTLRQPAAPDR